MRQITAYEAFGIFGDYDSNAPDTHTVCLVASEDLARQVCAKLNENPRDYCVVFVDGWEHSKRFAFRRELTDNPGEVLATLEAALAAIDE